MSRYAYDKSGVLDELELGERAADWLVLENQLGIFAFDWVQARIGKPDTEPACE